MTLKKLPEKMVVVGSGTIGVEFAYFYNSIGTEVTVVEYQNRIVPVEDKDVSKQLERSFRSRNQVKTSSEVLSVDTSGNGCVVNVKTKKRRKNRMRYCSFSSWSCCKRENIGLEDVGIVTDAGKIIVDDFYATNI